MATPTKPKIVGFGAYEFNPESKELRKLGMRPPGGTASGCRSSTGAMTTLPLLITPGLMPTPAAKK